MPKKIYKNFYEINRGYEQKTKKYKCPYILGVDIDAKEKQFLVAMGAHHSDTAANEISIEELVSNKWEEHIKKSNCQDFIKQLKLSIKKGEKFPQQFILNLLNL